MYKNLHKNASSSSPFSPIMWLKVDNEYEQSQKNDQSKSQKLTKWKFKFSIRIFRHYGYMGLHYFCLSQACTAGINQYG